MARRLCVLRRWVRNSTAMQASVSKACDSSSSLHCVLSAPRWALRAVQVLIEEGLARPILIGRPEVIGHRVARLELPLPGEMAAAIWTGTEPDDRVALMRRLRDLDRRLGAYATALDSALDDTTDELLMSMGSGATRALAEGLAEVTWGVAQPADVR